MSAFHPLQPFATDAKSGAMRWPWLIFGILLACGFTAFTINADWSAQSWLDLAAYAVSLKSVSWACSFTRLAVCSLALPFGGGSDGYSSAW